MTIPQLSFTDVILIFILITIFGSGILEALCEMININLKPLTKIRKIMFKDLHKKLDELNDRLSGSEKNRLRNRIVDFASDLKNGENKSEVQYKNICECYDKYHQMGGNSYVDGEIKYIKSKYKEEK